VAKFIRENGMRYSNQQHESTPVRWTYVSRKCDTVMDESHLDHYDEAGQRIPITMAAPDLM
jgi:hypothetical protein